MTTSTILLILLSIFIALGFSFYQYFYKNNSVSKVTWLLAVLRFLAVFGVLLLLINPILSSKTFEIIKTPLPIVVDNSSSIVDLKANKTAVELYEKLSSNSALKEKFDLQSYRFDSDFQAASTMDFKGKQTNIEEVAKNLKSIYRNATFPAVVITDGNQTIGNDYVYSFDANTKVYPLVLGDTTTFWILKLGNSMSTNMPFTKTSFQLRFF